MSDTSVRWIPAALILVTSLTLDAAQHPPISVSPKSTTATARGTGLDRVPTGVRISPGQSIQAAIDANPGGTTFTLLTGTHRLSTAIKPKSGDSFLGQDDTILS